MDNSKRWEYTIDTGLNKGNFSMDYLPEEYFFNLTPAQLREIEEIMDNINIRIRYLAEADGTSVVYRLSIGVQQPYADANLYAVWGQFFVNDECQLNFLIYPSGAIVPLIQ